MANKRFILHPPGGVPRVGSGCLSTAINLYVNAASGLCNSVRHTVTVTTPRSPCVKVVLGVAKSARPRTVGKGAVPQIYSADCTKNDPRWSEIQNFPGGGMPPEPS